MTYKKGLTKAKFKQMMRLFWTQKWKYERTPEEWVDCLFDRRGMKVKPPFGTKAMDILSSALDKLVLEKKLKKEESINLKKMLEGTSEDAFVAISAMAVLKPKKFKRERSKNTENNE